MPSSWTIWMDVPPLANLEYIYRRNPRACGGEGTHRAADRNCKTEANFLFYRTRDSRRRFGTRQGATRKEDMIAFDFLSNPEPQKLVWRTRSNHISCRHETSFSCRSGDCEPVIDGFAGGGFGGGVHDDF